MDRNIAQPSVTAPVTINEIGHAWETLRAAQSTAVTGNLKLLQATLDFGNTLIRAEHQMGFEAIEDEMDQYGVEEHTLKFAMKVARDNPNGISGIVSDPRKTQALVDQLLFPAKEVHPQTGERGAPPFQWVKTGLRLNIDPSEMEPDVVGELRRQAEPLLRIAFEFGWAKPA